MGLKQCWGVILRSTLQKGHLGSPLRVQGHHKEEHRRTQPSQAGGDRGWGDGLGGRASQPHQ